MAYTKGPYGSVGGAIVAPATMSARASLSSSRGIDARTMRYQVADDGGFEPMDDVTQRVLCILAFVVKMKGRIVPQEQAALKARIRTELRQLTDGQEPVIKLIDVTVTDDGRQTSYVGVTYKNLLTDTLNTVNP